jgi:hypothetical protein
MKRLLQILLILIALLAAAWFLLGGRLIESVIEREASNALGARVEIDRAGLRLFPAAITLHGVQATNPRAPMRNLVTAQSISADISLGQLLDRRIVSDTATLHGLRFDQPRTESGAIPGLTPEPEPEPAPPAAGIGLPDPQRLSAESGARIQGELERTGQAVEAIVAAWRERLAALPPQPGPDALRGLEHQLQQDRARIQQQLAHARNLPETELARLLAATGLDQRQPGNLSQALLAGELAPLIAQVLALLDAAPGTADAAGWPLLARRVELDGELALGASRLPFHGEIRNATPQPALWEMPLTFNLDGGERAGQFHATGRFDHQGSGDLQLALDGFNLSQLPLSRSELLGITLARGLTSAQGRLTRRGRQLDASLDAQFREAALAITAGDNPVAQRAAQLLGTVDGFDLQLRAQGRADAPQVTLRTSLDQMLDEALGQELQRQSGQLAGQLRGELERQLAPERARIAQLTAEFNALQQQLAERRGAPVR